MMKLANAYEGIMGCRPARAEPRSEATALYSADDRLTLALLSVPVLALVVGLSATHALKSGRTTLARAFPTATVPHAPIGPGTLQGTLIPSVVQALAPPNPVAPHAASMLTDTAPPPAAAPAAQVLILQPGGSIRVAVIPAQSPPLAVTPPLLSAPLQQRTALLAPSTLSPIELIPRPAPEHLASQDPVAPIENACLAPTSFQPVHRPRSDAASLTPAAFGMALAASAREQSRDFVIYNDTYRSLAYPGGDVHPLYGVCTDVIIRAYRGVGIDLQKLVHESRLGNGDISIDHRRTETLRRYFARFGERLPITSFAEDYLPGDIVTYDRPQNRHSRSHIAMVSDVVAKTGRYMIIHNRGWGPQLEDGLFVDAITGHYRYRDPTAVAIPVSLSLTPAGTTAMGQSATKPAGAVGLALTRASGKQSHLRREGVTDGVSVTGLGR